MAAFCCRLAPVFSVVLLCPCQEPLDDQGNYTIQLLVSPDMAEQINQSGLQRIADQKLMETQLETIVDNDYRLSVLELGL